MAEIHVRRATPQDAKDIVRLTRELAAYENEPKEAVKMTEADVLRHGFGERPYFEVILAELNSKPIGFALFFHNYSTWEGRPGIYVEDLFVEEPARGLGAGRLLMAAVARVAQERGCGRVELWVLHWNPTRDFYHRIGMRHMDEWLPYRLSGAAIDRLATEMNGRRL